MKHEILCRPAATAVRFSLDAEESLTCEVGAMIAMTSGLHVETTSRKRGGGGGLMKGLKRMLSGESFFLNHFTAEKPDQSLLIGPTMLGDCIHHAMRGGTMIVQGSSWMASSSDIEIDTTWQGFTSALFSGESMFWVKCSGDGDLFLSSYGAIYAVEVDGAYTVDTGHIVAFEDTLQFKLGKAGKSLIGSFLGGEGLVCKFQGQGTLYCQSHNPPSLGKLLGPKLKPK
ncbi:MAG: TIGR00266 family protein [Planctomycetota bacterium]|nr:TIGR00266 family protein [Planctomycetota bacterium]MDA1211674.1 TIGR00266 family protein [Planctomycetota bacterium]